MDVTAATCRCSKDVTAADSLSQLADTASSSEEKCPTATAAAASTAASESTFATFRRSLSHALSMEKPTCGTQPSPFPASTPLSGQDRSSQAETQPNTGKCWVSKRVPIPLPTTTVTIVSESSPTPIIWSSLTSAPQSASSSSTKSSARPATSPSLSIPPSHPILRREKAGTSSKRQAMELEQPSTPPTLDTKSAGTQSSTPTSESEKEERGGSNLSKALMSSSEEEESTSQEGDFTVTEASAPPPQDTECSLFAIGPS